MSAFFLFPDWEEAERLGTEFWAIPPIAPGPGEPRCPVPGCGSALRERPGEHRFECRSIYCDWVEDPRPVRKQPILPVPEPKVPERHSIDGTVRRVIVPPPPAPRQPRLSQARGDRQDDWKQGLGPKVRETKTVKYKIGVGDAHNPVLEITATSDDDAVAQAKKQMKKKLNAGEVREPKYGWVFHILERV